MLRSPGMGRLREGGGEGGRGVGRERERERERKGGDRGRTGRRVERVRGRE